MTGMRPALVITHAPHEGPGLIARGLDAPIRVRTVLDLDDARLPRLDEVSGIVVMGGPMDADDVPGHPGLAAERALVAPAVGAGRPQLGVCHGIPIHPPAHGSRCAEWVLPPSTSCSC